MLHCLQVVNGLKEKIDRFSRGRFEYELPGLVLSEERLVLTAEEGKECRGSFRVGNTAGRNMKAFLFCDEPEMELFCRQFEAAEEEVEVCFHGEYLPVGASQNGVIRIVSDLGEAGIPYEVKVEAAGFDTSIGRISDLFQFAGLARSSWEEAERIFASEDFCRVFLRGKTDETLLYQGLFQREDLGQRGTEQYRAAVSHAMEEFLRAIRKKTPVRLSVSRKEAEYHLAKMQIRDSILVKKEKWGYFCGEVRTDCAFVTLEKTSLSQEDFAGGVCEIPFILDPEKLRTARTTAKIEIITGDQNLSVEFEVFCAGNRKNKAAVRYKKKNYEVRLLRQYIRYRLGKITEEEYVTGSKAILYGLQVLTDAEPVKQLSAYLDMRAGRKSGEELTAFLRALNEQYPESRLFQSMYQEQVHTGKRQEKRPEKRIQELREQFRQGSRHPLLYLEAWELLIEAPELFTRLTDFELQVMNWSRKQKLSAPILEARFVYLSENTREKPALVCRYLTELYERRAERETLAAVCTLLLRERVKGSGRQAGVRAARWYRLGIEQGLKLTGLYEAYMDAAGEEIDPDTRIYTYFSRDNHLSASKKALLYENVIARKEDHPQVYRNYQEQIREFALKQLAAGEMDEHLAVVYEDMLAKPAFREQAEQFLPDVMFRCLVKCPSPEIKGVYVRHAECQKESYAAFTENGSGERVAFVDIFTESVGIFLVDGQGKRFAVTKPYEWKKLMPSGSYLRSCYEGGSRDYRLVLAFVSQTVRYHRQGVELPELWKSILELSELTPAYRNEILGGLIQDCYDRIGMMQSGEELLSGYLAEYELAYAEPEFRRSVMEMMLLRDMRQETECAIRQFGFRGISKKLLYRFYSRLLEEEMVPEDPEKRRFFVAVCWYLLQNGRTDNVMLQFLIREYRGGTAGLSELWMAAERAGIEENELSERLLAQMLFSETFGGQTVRVYRSFVQKLELLTGAAGKKLVRAFLAYQAYRYLVSDWNVEEELFRDMRTEVFYDGNDICKVAVLKYYSRKTELTEEEKEYSAVWMERMAKEGRILPFFQDFIRKCPVPPEIRNKSYVVYVTEPGEEAEIHYRLTENGRTEEYVTEAMPEVYQGIHVKETILFYGEKLQYYISVRKGDHSEITENRMMELSDKNEKEAIGVFDSEEDSYQLLNLILMAEELSDTATELELMRHFIRKKHVGNRLSQPL